MDVQYNSLVLVIFNKEQLRQFQKKYYASGSTTLFDIAREMKAEAADVINSFDFLDFAEELMRQTEDPLEKTTVRRKKSSLIQRL